MLLPPHLTSSQSDPSIEGAKAFPQRKPTVISSKKYTMPWATVRKNKLKKRHYFKMSCAKLAWQSSRSRAVKSINFSHQHQNNKPVWMMIWIGGNAVRVRTKAHPRNHHRHHPCLFKNKQLSSAPANIKIKLSRLREVALQASSDLRSPMKTSESRSWVWTHNIWAVQAEAS